MKCRSIDTGQGLIGRGLHRYNFPRQREGRPLIGVSCCPGSTEPFIKASGLQQAIQTNAIASFGVGAFAVADSKPSGS